MSAPDPPDFAVTCLLLFTINIGEKEFPMDLERLDAWMVDHPDSLDAYMSLRAQAVAAFMVNDMQATGSALEKMHWLVHMLRTLPLAVAAAHSNKRQGDRTRGNSKLTEEQKKRVKKYYAGRVNAGEKYGAIKALAAEFDVGETTIKGIIKRPVV